MQAVEQLRLPVTRSPRGHLAPREDGLVYVFGQTYQYFQFPVGGFSKSSLKVHGEKEQSQRLAEGHSASQCAASEQSVSASTIPGPFHFWPRTGETRALLAPGGTCVCRGGQRGKAAVAACPCVPRIWPREFP
ncbi:hypothetical protein MRX96_030922 [Rhipicephalus microplus]